MKRALQRWHALRAGALGRWRARPPREQRLIAVAAIALLLLFVWLVALRPALRTLADAPRQLDALEVQWQSVQQLAAEARQLRGASPLPAAQAQAALRAATEPLGDKARLVVQGDRVQVTLNAVSGTALQAWLREIRGVARARAIEASLARAGDGYSGSIVLALPGGGG